MGVFFTMRLVAPIGGDLQPLASLVSLPRHRGPPWLESHTSGRTTSKGEDQSNFAQVSVVLPGKGDASLLRTVALRSFREVHPNAAAAPLVLSTFSSRLNVGPLRSGALLVSS